MYEINCEFDSLWFQDHPMNLENVDNFWPRIHTFLSITKINIPLKVPYLLTLGHRYLSGIFSNFCGFRQQTCVNFVLCSDHILASSILCQNESMISLLTKSTEVAENSS